MALSREEYNERHRVIHKLSRERVRAEVIDAYGGKCVCCGETQPLFLTVDHIFNDGAAQRRERKTKTGTHFSGTVFYRWLKNNGFPKDRFQLLCMNCNVAKGVYGFCPHVACPVRVREVARLSHPNTAHITESDLRHMYLDERLSAKAIAKHYGVDDGAILQRLHGLGIARNATEAQRLTRKPLPDETLIELYVNRGLSGRAVAKKMGRVQPVIYRRIKELGLERGRG